MLKKISSKYHRDGITGLVLSTPRFVTRQAHNAINRVIFPVWSRLPATRNAIWNDVKVPSEVAPGPRHLDTLISAPVRTDYPKSEAGEVAGHEHRTQSGDNVVIIGGGRGVTAVRAAQAVGPEGSVLVYEGGQEYVELIRDVASLNGVSNRVEVRHALVGPGLSIYGTPDGAESVDPAEIPECDVLELDCEGAEAEIFPHLEVRPRVIILEVHAREYDNPERWRQDLDDLGYEIVDRRTNEGEPLTETGLRNEIMGNVEGDKHSPIVIAIHQDYYGK